VANPNPKTEQIKPHQIQPAEVELGKVIGTRYPVTVQAELDRLPEKQAFIRQAVEKNLKADRPSPSPTRSPVPHPETHLQTLTTLNPKECSFRANGKRHSGAIAAVLVDWHTANVKAVLINTPTDQVQIPLANVTLKMDNTNQEEF
jgi:hypothetical protein